MITNNPIAGTGPCAGVGDASIITKAGKACIAADSLTACSGSVEYQQVVLVLALVRGRVVTDDTSTIILFTGTGFTGNKTVFHSFCVAAVPILADAFG